MSEKGVKAEVKETIPIDKEVTTRLGFNVLVAQLQEDARTEIAKVFFNEKGGLRAMPVRVWRRRLEDGTYSLWQVERKMDGPRDPRTVHLQVVDAIMKQVVDTLNESVVRSSTKGRWKDGKMER